MPPSAFTAARNPFDRLVRALAAAFRAGAWTLDGLVDRGADVLGQRPRWLHNLAGRVLTAAPGREGLTADRLVAILARDRGLKAAWRRAPSTVRTYFIPPQEAAPPRIPLRAPLPDLATPGDLAAWLGRSVPRLDGLADVRGLHLASSERLRNYRRWWVASRSPGGHPRLLEAPKDLLRSAQRRILREIVGLVPPHPAAHGFVEGRSVWTAASVHAGEAVLVRLDLQSFFPSIHRRRIVGVFEAIGLPPRVAFVLAALCTTTTPPSSIQAMPSSSPSVAARYRQPHLPQGAPTSPALANLCAYRLDARIAGLARRLGLRYTRYADDLYLSGPRRDWAAIVRSVARIATGEGFAPNSDKTRIMGPGRAHRCLGLVVDQHPAVPRRERKQLEAILVNCVRHGPEGQNRSGHPRFRAHLEGRVAWVAQVSPRHAVRLQALLERIRWP